MLCAPQTTYRVLTASGWQEHDLPKGQYKTQPNHVLLKTARSTPTPRSTRFAAEMHRLVEQLRSPAFEAAHPVLQASWVHYAFVAIHPFADGNGRVARALASVYFYRCCSIPLLVFANQRLAYFDALHTADLGELRPLIGFFRDRGIDTMQLVSESVVSASLPRVEELGRKIGLQAPGRRLLGATLGTLERRFEGLNLPPNLSLECENRSDLAALIQIWEKKDHSKLLELAADLEITVEIEPESHFALRIVPDQNDDVLQVRTEDVVPELSPALHLRLDRWVERQLSRLLGEIERQARMPP